jgi:phospholipid/cholesterol/gamma-HCH transport system permease protein
MSKCFVAPEKFGVFRKQVAHEMNNLGIRSITIVVIISIFMGAVITIQTALNLENPLIPKYYIGLGTRDSMLLEFSSTVVGLILAGKVGSNIASELGSMRISEQIDALDIMGVNSASYLILPKIIAAILFHPVLNAISIFVGIFGGWLAAVSTRIVNPAEFLYGVHYWFEPFYVTYSFIKTIVFAFIITTVSAYHGYYVRGGSLEVGRASTRAVVNSSVLILLFNLILTQIMLT